MQATRIRTKTKDIITALEELIGKTKIAEIKQFKGKLDDFNVDLQTLRDRP